MQLRQRPTNKWFFEGKMWKFTIASACSTPPTSSCYLQCLINVFAMTHSSLCYERKAWNILAANSGCSLQEPLSLSPCLYVYAFQTLETESAALYTYKHSHIHNEIVGIVLSSCRWKIVFASAMKKIGEKKWKEGNRNTEKLSVHMRQCIYLWCVASLQ